MKTQKSDSEEYFDCASSVEEIIASTFKQKVPEIRRDLPFRSTSSLSSIHSQVKIINAEYLKNLPKIHKLKVLHKPESEFSNLRLMQEIPLFDQKNTENWIVKFSQDCYFLTVSGQHVINIYELQTNVFEIPVLYKPTPQILRYRNGEITCTSWSFDNLIYSGSKNGEVAQWRMDKEKPINCWMHPNEVRAVECHLLNSEIFVTACVDLIIRVFSANHGIIGYYQCICKPTCMSFDSISTRLAVGTQKGEVMIYRSFSLSKLRLIYILQCRNSKGIYSRGRKVANVALCGDYTLVSTNDSRIRLYKAEKLIHKFKGHKNSNSPFPISFSEDMKHIISGSTNGQIFIWDASLDNESQVKLKKFESFSLKEKRKKEFATFLPGKLMGLFRNIYKTQGQFVKNIFISVGSRGNLLIFSNFLGK